MPNHRYHDRKANHDTVTWQSQVENIHFIFLSLFDRSITLQTPGSVCHESQKVDQVPPIY